MFTRKKKVLFPSLQAQHLLLSAERFVSVETKHNSVLSSVSTHQGIQLWKRWRSWAYPAKWGHWYWIPGSTVNGCLQSAFNKPVYPLLALLLAFICYVQLSVWLCCNYDGFTANRLLVQELVCLSLCVISEQSTIAVILVSSPAKAFVEPAKLSFWPFYSKDWSLLAFFCVCPCVSLKSRLCRIAQHNIKQWLWKKKKSKGNFNTHTKKLHLLVLSLWAGKMSVHIVVWKTLT